MTSIDTTIDYGFPSNAEETCSWCKHDCGHVAPASSHGILIVSSQFTEGDHMPSAAEYPCPTKPESRKIILPLHTFTLRTM